MGKTCFFISRIGDPGSTEREFSDKLLTYIVQPVLEKCGYERSLRADHIAQPGVITTQVFTYLWNADLVIADLTGSNPNVYYELAVRHVRRKPFVHLIQSGHKIPFDIAPNRTIEFDFDIARAETAKAALTSMLANTNDEPGCVLTPLSAAIDFAAAGTSSDPTRDAIAQILSIVQELRGSSIDRQLGDVSFSPMKPGKPFGPVLLRKIGPEYDLSAGGRSVILTSPDQLNQWLMPQFGPEKTPKIIERAELGETIVMDFTTDVGLALFR